MSPIYDTRDPKQHAALQAELYGMQKRVMEREAAYFRNENIPRAKRAARWRACVIARGSLWEIAMRKRLRSIRTER